MAQSVLQSAYLPARQHNSITVT